MSNFEIIFLLGMVQLHILIQDGRIYTYTLQKSRNLPICFPSLSSNLPSSKVTESHSNLCCIFFLIRYLQSTENQTTKSTKSIKVSNIPSLQQVACTWPFKIPMVAGITPFCRSTACLSLVKMWLLVHWQVAGLKGQHIMVPANSYYHGSLHQLHLRIHQGGVPFNKINPDQWPFADVESSHTLLKFNSSPLKIGHPKRKPDRLPSIHFFSGYVSVEDGNKPATSNSPTH